MSRSLPHSAGQEKTRLAHRRRTLLIEAATRRGAAKERGAMELELAGKVVWVLGGTGSLGGPICSALASQGAHVIVSSRRAEACAALARSLPGDGHGARAVNVADSADMHASVAAIVAEHGAIDILVNSMNLPAYGRFLELDRATFQAALDVKYHGYISAMQAVLPGMVAAGGGSIVNITGTGGTLPSAIHLPGGSINAALNLIVKGLASEFGASGVRINAVAPGPIRSPRQEAAQHVGGKAPYPVEDIPLGRFGVAEEVADAVLLLA